MININKLTGQQICKMSYNELIGITKETNKTPGGLNTIKRVSNILMLNRDTRILDIGTSTGHTAIEFNRLLKCSVTAIDINKVSLQTAKERSKKLGLKNVDFIRADATNLAFKNNSFDVVFCGNVTSLVDNARKALDEYWRVVNEQGYLVAVPMYYVKTPPSELVEKVREAIKVNISVLYKEDWLNFYLDRDVEIYASEDYVFNKIDSKVVENFCSQILKRKHLSTLKDEARVALNECYQKYMHLFNNNLSHMGYSLLVLRKKEGEEFNDPELFTGRPI